MKKIFLYIAVSVLFAACESTRITSSWQARDVATRSFNRILVLALVNEPDRTIRQEMEAQLVNELKAIGYDAVCSCDEFDPKTFEGLSEKEALSKLSKGGIDGVLTVVLLDKDKERYYVPGRVVYTPYVTYHHRFWGYYNTMYNRVYTPGYYVTDTRYFWETNLYAINGGQELLYSVQSQSFNPGSAKVLGHEYGEAIIQDMIRRSVLINRKGEVIKPA